jgi:hypothetical protein
VRKLERAIGGALGKHDPRHVARPALDERDAGGA